MRFISPLRISFGCSLLAFAAWAAEPEPRAAKTRTEVDQQLAEISRQQLELSFTLRDQTRKNETLWADPQFTSPEIEKLRKRLEVMQQEILQLQIALRERVAELPAAQVEVAKLAQAKAMHQALARRIEELKKLREQLP
ncbi:MAG: hypothetical protein ACOYOU_01180 [Kiritimatiellia bacterium]